MTKKQAKAASAAQKRKQAVPEQVQAQLGAETKRARTEAPSPTLSNPGPASKIDTLTLRRVIELRASQYPATRVLIEDKGAGSSLIQDLRRTTPLRPIPFVPEGDKVSRFVCQTAVIERGDVLLPRQAPWLEEFRRELLQFPHARHDDQVDALAQYLAYMDSRRRNRVVVGDIGDILWGRGMVGRR
jgi:predicted phage terminase large subunit-like protein